VVVIYMHVMLSICNECVLQEQLQVVSLFLLQLYSLVLLFTAVSYCRCFIIIIYDAAKMLLRIGKAFIKDVIVVK